MRSLNYWERLKAFNLSSVQRRIERYRIIYSWKSLNGLAPSLGLRWNNREGNGRNGRVLEVAKVSGATGGLKTLSRETIWHEGAKLLNAIPCQIRNFVGDISHFKNLLDNFLSLVDDQPETESLRSNLLDSYGNSTNSLYYWCVARKINWTPNLPLVTDGQLYKIYNSLSSIGDAQLNQL